MTTDWVTVDQVIEYLGSDAPPADDLSGQARLAQCISSSSECLYGLSGRKFPGILSTTVRPTARFEQQAFPESRVVTWPHNSWGVCCGYPHRNCEAPKSIGLGRGPIVSVEQVTLPTGDVLDPLNYIVEDQKWLRRTDCYAWPMCGCEDCEHPFTVTFTFGEDPPQVGIDAATVLSAEFYRAMTPSTSGCKLPARLTSITRQGVTMAIVDPMDFFKSGLTGNYQIDLFLTVFNPGRQIRKPIAFSPDAVNHGRRQTWP